MDHLSSLPDDILCKILVRLQSLFEAARTSVLSKRWRNLWASMHRIYFQWPDAGLTPDRFSSLSKSFIRCRPSDLTGVSVLVLDLHRCNLVPQAFRCVEQLLMHCNVRDLRLVSHNYGDTYGEQILADLIAKRKRLRRLETKMNQLPDLRGFSFLKCLHLEKIKSSKSSFGDDLAKDIPLLKILCLKNCKFRTIKLDHPRVAMLSVIKCEVVEIRIFGSRISFLVLNIYKSFKTFSLRELPLLHKASLRIQMYTKDDDMLQEIVSGIRNARRLRLGKFNIRLSELGIIPTFRNLKFINTKAQLDEHAAHMLREIAKRSPKLKNLVAEKRSSDRNDCRSSGAAVEIKVDDFGEDNFGVELLKFLTNNVPRRRAIISFNR